MALLISGCGTLYELEIIAKNPQGSGTQGTYVLLPGDPMVPVDSEEFARYSAYIQRSLRGTQLARVPVSQIADADMAIVVNYWVGDSETVAYKNTVPMFQTVNEAGADDGPSGRSGSGGSSQNPSGAAGTVDPPPRQELLGTSSYTFVRTVFWRDLSLRAITFEWDPAASPSVRKTGDLWYLAVATQGSSDDLDEVLPAMAAAAAQYIGSDLEEPVTEKMNGIDRKIKAIRTAP